MRTSNAGPDPVTALDTKRNVIGVEIDAVTPNQAVDRVIEAAKEHRTYRVSALAVHGVIEAISDPEHLTRINSLEMVTPDGQPVRWALNLLHEAHLFERVYGPTLMLNVCRRAAAARLPVYLYGSTQDVIDDLVASLEARFPCIQIAGAEPSRFRRVTEPELREICTNIRATGAAITFVGLGCPRQEIFAYESGPLLKMPVLAVGAAFEYHAGHKDEPPTWVQRYGLQWAHRLASDPKRLWKRYATTNPQFIAAVLRQRIRGAEGRPQSAPTHAGWA